MELWIMLGVVAVNVIGWSPSDVMQFWVKPDQVSVFRFNANFDSESKFLKTDGVCSVKYEIKTTDGTILCNGDGEVEYGQLCVEAKLGQGFYELVFPQTGQIFGIVSQPATCEFSTEIPHWRNTNVCPLDDFFGLDAASTWLVEDDKARKELIINAKRFGVTTYRERFNWARVQPHEDKFDFDGDFRAVSGVREIAKKYELPILELFHNVPEWIGKIGEYPADLIKTADSWRTIGTRWSKYWNSIEVWNEPDISFSGDLPADQYVPVLKTVAQEFNRNHIQTPIVGGVIAAFRDEFMNGLVENGFLDACDIFSFHAYCQAFEMEDVCLKYYEWLKKNHAEWKPVWVTESGRPWCREMLRPTQEMDLESAINIVQKAVVTKALGYDAFFPFVYVFYEEGGNNFGMCDRNNAPLRSIAGYARTIFLLSGKKCIGTWNIDGVERAYLFSNDESTERVAVLYSRDRIPSRKLKLPIEPLFAERITGEGVTTDSEGCVDFSDGFLFIGIPQDSKLVLKEADNFDKARLERLEMQNKQEGKKRTNFSTVLRFNYDEQCIEINGDCYMLTKPNIDLFTGKISVFNFDTVPKSFIVTALATVDNNGVEEELVNAFTKVPATVDVPARSCTNFEFTLDASKISPFNVPTYRFKVGNEATLAFKISRKISQADFKSFVSDVVYVDLTDISRIQKNLSKSKSFDLISHDGKCCYQVQFEEEGDKWAYPLYSLPLELDLKGNAFLILVDGTRNKVVKYNMNDFKGVAFTAKILSNNPKGLARFFTFSEKGNYYYTASSFMATDGVKRFIVLPFSLLNPYGGVSELFDPVKIRSISVGANSKGDQLTVEIEDFCFFK